MFMSHIPTVLSFCLKYGKYHEAVPLSKIKHFQYNLELHKMIVVIFGLETAKTFTHCHKRKQVMI